MEDFLEGLNDGQKGAVLHLDTPLLVLAGAGSGKTRVITYKIMYLHRYIGIPIDRILAITFTNKAAKEMKERVKDILKLESEPPWISTFHSISAKILRIEAHHIGYDRNFIIYDDDDKTKTVKEVLEELNIDDNLYSVDKVKDLISQIKQSTEDYTLEFLATNYSLLPQIYERYNEKLALSNAMDFDDIILNVVELFKNNLEILDKWRFKFDYILVDEYQDTNKIQHELLKLIVGDRDCITVVGDPQQCIYTWRGATPENILDFEEDFPNTKIIKLEKNYRSTKKILETANKIIEKSKGRWKKKVLKLWTDKYEGEDIELYKLPDEKLEGAFLVKSIKKFVEKEDRNYSDIAVLIRMSFLSRVIEEFLVKEKIPYQIIGGLKFYERAEIKDLLAFFKFSINPMDSQSFKRIVDIYLKGFGKKSLEKLEILREEQKINYIEALNLYFDNLSKNQKIVVQEFLDIINYISNYGNEHPYRAIKYLYKAIDYQEYIKQKYKKDWEDREGNIKELFVVLNELERKGKTIREFLEETVLSQAQDNLEDNNTVKIMTVHASKGLEFPIVFLPALEDGIFPSGRAIFNHEQLEEERRLFYVAITRAKEKVIMSYSERRTNFKGFLAKTKSSRFLEDIKGNIKVKGLKRGSSRKNTKKIEEKAGSNLNIKSNPFLNPKLNEVNKNKNLSSNKNSVNFKIGELVKHKKFGKGVIKDINQDRATVIFGTEGEKKILLEYLEKFY